MLTITFQECSHQIAATKEQMVGQDQRLWYKQARGSIKGAVNRQRHNSIHGTGTHLARDGQLDQLHGS